MRKISLQSSLQTTHTTAWKCRSLCSPGRGAAASYFGRRSGISVAWGEILDTDTRVREVTGSLLSEHCSSAGQPTWGQMSPSIPPRWRLPLKSSSACTSCHSSMGAAPGPAGPLSSRGTSAQAHSLHTKQGGACSQNTGTSLGLQGAAPPHGFPPSPCPQKQGCLKQTCPVLKYSSLFQLSTAFEVWQCRGISKAQKPQKMIQKCCHPSLECTEQSSSRAGSEGEKI